MKKLDLDKQLGDVQRIGTEISGTLGNIGHVIAHAALNMLAVIACDIRAIRDMMEDE